MAKTWIIGLLLIETRIYHKKADLPRLRIHVNRIMIRREFFQIIENLCVIANGREAISFRNGDYFVASLLVIDEYND